MLFAAFTVALVLKNLPAIAGDLGDTGQSLGRCPGGGHGNPLQCSFLENPMDRGACWATVHRVTQSQAWLKWLISSSSDLRQHKWCCTVAEVKSSKELSLKLWGWQGRTFLEAVRGESIPLPFSTSSGPELWLLPTSSEHITAVAISVIALMTFPFLVSCFF